MSPAAHGLPREDVLEDLFRFSGRTRSEARLTLFPSTRGCADVEQLRFIPSHDTC